MPSPLPDLENAASQPLLPTTSADNTLRCLPPTSAVIAAVSSSHCHLLRLLLPVSLYCGAIFSIILSHAPPIPPASPAPATASSTRPRFVSQIFAVANFCRNHILVPMPSITVSFCVYRLPTLFSPGTMSRSLHYLAHYTSSRRLAPVLILIGAGLPTSTMRRYHT